MKARVKNTFIEEDNIKDDVVSNLNIPKYENPSTNLENNSDLLEKIIKKYKKYPSILAILQQQFENSFPISIIPKEGIENDILNLHYTKA